MKTLEEVYEKIKDKVTTNFENDCITVTFGHYSKSFYIRFRKSKNGNYDLEINGVISMCNFPFKTARSKFMKAIELFS